MMVSSIVSSIFLPETFSCFQYLTLSFFKVGTLQILHRAADGGEHLHVLRDRLEDLTQVLQG